MEVRQGNPTIRTSVFRLMPIYQDPIQQQNKDQKIDEIRKKLRIMGQLRTNVKIHNPSRNQPLLNILLGKFQSQTRKSPSETANKENSFKSDTHRYTPQLRKTKTENSQLFKEKLDKPKCRTPLHTEDPKTRTNQSTATRVFVAQTEQTPQNNLFRNFRVSEQLKNLRKCSNHGIDEVIEKPTATKFTECSNKTENKMKREESKGKTHSTGEKSFSLKEFSQIRPNKTSSQVFKRSSSIMRPKAIGSGKKFNISLSNVKNLNDHQEFIRLVRLTNRIWAREEQNEHPCKFYVGPGNNDGLVRSLLRRRGWVEVNKIKDANLIWTQKRDLKLIDSMKKTILGCVTEKQAKKINQHKWRCECNPNKVSKECTHRKLTMSESHQNPIRVNFKAEEIKVLGCRQEIRTHNHLAHHEQICYKKNLFLNLRSYYQSVKKNPFSHIPLTFHIEAGQCDEWKSFLMQYEKGSWWILKPGQNTNRGHGIMVERDLHKIKKNVDAIVGGKATAIIQKYIMPLLYKGRKFDIRCYALATATNGQFQVYWYERGYVRTVSKEFDIDDNNRYIHLTNDAVQKSCPEYGKYETSNKLSFEALAEYLRQNWSVEFFESIQPQMVGLCRDAFDSTWDRLHDQEKEFCYQVFGLDFMIDEDFKVWLIQVNRNPCLETNCSLLRNVIGSMLDNALMLANDPFFKWRGKSGEKPEQVDNKFTLILRHEYPSKQ